MGNISEVKELLEGGADVNERNNVSTRFGIIIILYILLYNAIV